jgi:hypothetical protein
MANETIKPISNFLHSWDGGDSGEYQSKLGYQDGVVKSKLHGHWMDPLLHV